MQIFIRLDRPKTDSYLTVSLDIKKEQEIIANNQSSLSQAVDNFTRKWFPDWGVITYGKKEDFCV